jgi:hypothetical protein
MATNITVSGTGGSGFITLPNQGTLPPTPTSSLNLYSNATGELVHMGSDGFTRTFSDAITANRTYTFPDTDGAFATDNGASTLTNKTLVGGSNGNVVSANQLLGITISGTPTNGQLLGYSGASSNWIPTTVSGGGGGSGALASQIWIIKDIKSIGTNGGIFTANSWITRTLNNMVGSGVNCAINTNQITLTAGTYYIQARVPAVNVGYHACKLYNITGAADVAFGSVLQGGNIYESSYSLLDTIVTIAGNTVYEIQHRCSLGSSDKTGLGVASGFITSETYTTVIIQQLN